MINDNALELIKRFEGLRLTAYKCPAGVYTIGYGHTNGVQRGQRCTELQAELWLMDDLREAEQAVDYLTRVPLTDNQRGALVSFVFNVGGGNFAASTLLKKLNAGDYAGAASEFARWNKTGGKILPGLTTRRQAEAVLFLSPGPVAPLVTYHTRKPGKAAEQATRALQGVLQVLGLYDGALDGIPGRATSDAIERLLGNRLKGEPQ
jgi:lysozyme